MNPLLRWLTSPEWTHVVGALLHSLWQGAIIAIALAVLMRRLTNPVTRYRCALGMLGVLVVASIITWAVLNAPPPTTPITAPFPAAESAFASTPTTALNLNSTDKIVVVSKMSLPTASMNWSAWLALVWMLGAGVMLLRASIKVAGAENLRRSCKPLDDERMLSLVAEAFRAVDLARRIRVAVTDKLTSPAVVGVIVPTLILPLSLFSALTSEQIRFVLLHELAHIRRGDYLANLFQLFAEALLFFNPAVWWISHQIRREREACCDALAIELSGAPADYAKTLVRVAENILQPTTSAALAFGDDGREPSPLADRVQRLLVPGYRPALRLTWRAMLTSLFAGGALLVLSAVGTRNTVGAILSPRNAVSERNATSTSSNKLADEYAFALTNPVVQITNSQSSSVAEVFNLGNDGSSSPNHLDGVLIFTNGARVKYNDQEITADILKINQATGELVAEGNVRLKTTNRLAAVDRIFGNIKTNRRSMGEGFWTYNLKTARSNQFAMQRADQDVGDVTEASTGSLEHLSQKKNEIPLPGGVIASTTSDETQWFHYDTMLRNGRQAMLQKLDQIRLDNYSCDKLPLKEVIRRLFEEARQHDPANQGINFAIAGPSLARPPVTEVAAIPISISPEHRVTSLGTILYYVVKGAATPIDYSIRDNDVVFYLKKGAAEVAGNKTNPAKRNSGSSAITLTDGNSTAQLDPDNAIGMNSWTMGGQNQTNQQWFWYRTGGTNHATQVVATNASKAEPASVLVEGGSAQTYNSILRADHRLNMVRIDDEVYFVRQPLPQVVYELSEKARRGDPNNIGVEFALDPGLNVFDPATGLVVLPDSNELESVSVTLRFRITGSLKTILDNIVTSADRPIKYTFTNNIVRFSLRSAPESEPLFAREFELPAKTFYGKILTNLPQAELNRVASSNLSPAALEAFLTWLSGAGVNLDPKQGKSIYYKDRKGLLFARATLAELDAIEMAVMSLNEASAVLATRTFNVGPLELTRALGRTGSVIVTNTAELVAACLAKAGVDLQPPKAVFFKDPLGLLMVRALPAELDAIEKFLAQGNRGPASTTPSPNSFRVENNPATSTASSNTNLHTRIFGVDANALVQALERRLGTKVFSGPKPDETKLLPVLRQFFATVGVDLDVPKAVYFNGTKGELFVRATLADLDAIKALLEVLNYSSPQVNLKVRWIEVKSPSADGTLSQGVLSEAQTGEVLQRLNYHDGFTLLSEGQITTLSTGQAQFQVAEVRTIVTGIKPAALTAPGIVATNATTASALDAQTMSFGPVLDVIPCVGSDQNQIALHVEASTKEFLGYNKKSPQVPVYINGKKLKTTLPLPTYQVRQITNDSLLHDGETLVLGHLPVKEIAQQSNGEIKETEVTDLKANSLYVLVTATLIDPAGNRLNPPKQASPSSR